jgi:glucoamylase
VPLVWAHSEYIKLVRSAADGRVFDLVEPVHDRYVLRHGERKAIEVWKLNRQVQIIDADTILRIQANSPFLLHWTKDDWKHSTDTQSRTTAMGIDYADIAASKATISLQFTFFWVEENRWEGKETFKSMHLLGGGQNCVVSESLFRWRLVAEAY